MRGRPVFIVEKDAVMTRMHLIYAHRGAQVHVYFPEMPAVAEHMIRNIKVGIVYIHQDRALQQGHAVVAETYYHYDVLPGIKRIVSPVASCAAVIALKQIKVACQLLTPACSAGIDICIQLLYIGCFQVASYVIFIEKEKLASLPFSSFVGNYPRGGNIDE